MPYAAWQTAEEVCKNLHISPKGLHTLVPNGIKDSSIQLIGTDVRYDYKKVEERLQNHPAIRDYSAKNHKRNEAYAFDPGKVFEEWLKNNLE